MSIDNYAGPYQATRILLVSRLETHGVWLLGTSKSRLKDFPVASFAERAAIPRVGLRLRLLLQVIEDLPVPAALGGETQVFYAPYMRIAYEAIWLGLDNEWRYAAAKLYSARSRHRYFAAIKNDVNGRLP